MTHETTSVAMTATTEKALLSLLVRSDGQEDVCLATYRPSTGMTRVSALITSVIPPQSEDRFVRGNATVTGKYILRGAEIAQRLREKGPVLPPPRRPKSRFPNYPYANPRDCGWHSIMTSYSSVLTALGPERSSTHRCRQTSS